MSSTCFTIWPNVWSIWEFTVKIGHFPYIFSPVCELKFNHICIERVTRIVNNFRKSILLIAIIYQRAGQAFISVENIRCPAMASDYNIPTAPPPTIINILSWLPQGGIQKTKKTKRCNSLSFGQTSSDLPSHFCRHLDASMTGETNFTLAPISKLINFVLFLCHHPPPSPEHHNFDDNHDKNLIPQDPGWTGSGAKSSPQSGYQASTLVSARLHVQPSTVVSG